MRSGEAAKAPLLDILLLGVLVLVLSPGLILLLRQHILAEQAWVSVEISSDPTGAVVIVDNIVEGETPTTLVLRRGDELSYTVRAAEPLSDFDLYRPYHGSFVAERDSRISVWLERTTPEEQDAQRARRRSP